MTESDTDPLTLPAQLKIKTIPCRPKRKLKHYIGLVVKIIVIRLQFNHIHTGETLRTCSWSTLLPLSILHTRSSKKHGCAHKITQGKHKIIFF